MSTWSNVLPCSYGIPNLLPCTQVTASPPARTGCPGFLSQPTPTVLCIDSSGLHDGSHSSVLTTTAAISGLSSRALPALNTFLGLVSHLYSPEFPPPRPEVHFLGLGLIAIEVSWLWGQFVKLTEIRKSGPLVMWLGWTNEASVSKRHGSEQQADLWRCKESLSRRWRGKQEGTLWLDLHKQDSSSNTRKKGRAGTCA